MVLDVPEAQASTPWEELDEWNASPNLVIGNTGNPTRYLTPVLFCMVNYSHKCLIMHKKHWWPS